MNITIDLNKYPKIKDIENKEEMINTLINIGYNNFFFNEQNNLIDKLNNKISENFSDKIDILDNNINKLFGLNNSSNKKGEISENIIYEYISNRFPDYCYEKKRTISHNADGELTSPSGLVSLVEVKNYENNVNKDEINKFKNDLISNNIKFGLFISIKSGIIGKKLFDVESFTDNNNEFNIIYINNIYQNNNIIEASILLLEKIYILSKNKISKCIEIMNFKENLNDLNNMLMKTNLLHNKYLKLESVIKNSFNEFYQDLRNYELEVKYKINNILSNIDNQIDILNIKDDDREKILIENKDDKCLILISKLFNILINYKIIKNDKNWEIINTSQVGIIKKLKDKLNLEFNNSIKISLDSKNIDENLKVINNILNH